MRFSDWSSDGCSSDIVIAMGSSGLHSNGYSLARKVLLEIDRMNLSAHVDEFGRTLGEELPEPTKIYAKDCLALAAETDVRTFCHVTGRSEERRIGEECVSTCKYRG